MQALPMQYTCNALQEQQSRMHAVSQRPSIPCVTMFRTEAAELRTAASAVTRLNYMVSGAGAFCAHRMSHIAYLINMHFSTTAAFETVKKGINDSNT